MEELIAASCTLRACVTVLADYTCSASVEQINGHVREQLLHATRAI